MGGLRLLCLLMGLATVDLATGDLGTVGGCGWRRPPSPLLQRGTAGLCFAPVARPMWPSLLSLRMGGSSSLSRASTEATPAKSAQRRPASKAAASLDKRTAKSPRAKSRKVTTRPTPSTPKPPPPPHPTAADDSSPAMVEGSSARSAGSGFGRHREEGQGREDANRGDGDKGAEGKRKKKLMNKAIMRDFEVKAELLLQEAGGRLSSDQFAKRWRFAYPMNRLEVYRQGRHISARQLVEKCNSDKIRVEPKPWVHRHACDLVLQEQRDESERYLVSGDVRNRSASAMDWLSPEMMHVPSDMQGVWEEQWEQAGGQEEASEQSEDEAPAAKEGEDAWPACELNVASDEHGRSVEDGLELIQTMRASGITFGNIHSYCALLQGCARAAGPEAGAAYGEKALTILRLMAEVNVEPDEEAYSHAVTACARSGMLFRSVDLLKKMSDEGLGPARDRYNVVVDACVREAQTGNSIAMELGVRVLKMMREAGIAADAVRCFALMDTPYVGEWCSHCRLEIVKVLQEMGTEDVAVMEARKLLDRYNAKQGQQEA